MRLELFPNFVWVVLSHRHVLSLFHKCLNSHVGSQALLGGDVYRDRESAEPRPSSAWVSSAAPPVRQGDTKVTGHFRPDTSCRSLGRLRSAS